MTEWVAEAPLAQPAADARCSNCGAALVGRYCHACGQDTVPADTAWRSWVDQWHKLQRTLDALVLHPGLLTQQHLGGGRVRYVPPLTLYLNTVALFFVFSALVDFRLAAFVGGTLPAFFQDIIARRSAAEHISEALFMERADRRFQTVYTICVSVISVLGYAAVARLLFARRWKGWRGPLTLALHFMAFVFMAYMPLTILATKLARALGASQDTVTKVFLACAIPIVAWFVLAIRRLFDDRWPWALAKAATITLAGLPINIVMLNAAVIITLAIT